MSIVPLYYSRELRIAEISDESDRVQYFDVQEDEARILAPIEATSEVLKQLLMDLEQYFADIRDGDPSEIRQSRIPLVYDWAMLQAVVSKLAWVLRIDGNEAFQRLVDSIKNNREADMEGL